MAARYGGFFETVVVPHEVFLRLQAEAPHVAREKGNPPRLRLFMGEARYEVIVECAPEIKNRMIKGILDLTKDR